MIVWGIWGTKNIVEWNYKTGKPRKIPEKPDSNHHRYLSTDYVTLGMKVIIIQCFTQMCCLGDSGTLRLGISGIMLLLHRLL